MINIQNTSFGLQNYKKNTKLFLKSLKFCTFAVYYTNPLERFMITFFKKGAKTVYAVESDHQLSSSEISKMEWLLQGTLVDSPAIGGTFVGPRREMITPWSTNAVEITQNMSINGVKRIEEYFPVKDENASFDPMLQRLYDGVGQDCFTIDKQPDPIVYIENLEEYKKFLTGTYNSSLVRTANGKVILLNLSTTAPHPYSRMNTIQGTHGILMDYPLRIDIEKEPGSGPRSHKGIHSAAFTLTGSSRSSSSSILSPFAQKRRPSPNGRRFPCGAHENHTAYSCLRRSASNEAPNSSSNALVGSGISTKPAFQET